MRKQLVLAAALVTGVVALASAQGGDGATPQGAAQLGPLTFTAGQVEEGQALYEANCGFCHGEELGGDDGPPLAEGALDHWFSEPVAAFYQFVRQNMPLGTPGSLSSTEYAAIVAFLLSHNGFEPGDEPLSNNVATLQAIGFHQ